jgi:hypothetical protein
MSIAKHRMSERLVIEKVYGDGYQDSTWGEHVGHVKAFVGVESEGTADHFIQAEKYLTLFLHLYTLLGGQPYVVFRSMGTPIDSFTYLGERSFGYPGHNPIIQIGEPIPSDVRYVARLEALFQQVESEYESITESPLGLAMQFYYDAVMSNHRRRLELAVVHFMMAAEALVILGDESKRQNVSRRISSLFSETSEEYETVYKNMKELWGVRNGIVHGGGKKTTPMEVGRLFQYLRKALLDRLSFRRFSKIDLVEKLDKISSEWDLKTELEQFRQFDWKEL